MRGAPLDFRRAYARLVTRLVARAGPAHLQAAEDAAQHALVAALETWPRRGEPKSPQAWLDRVARNHLMGALRTTSRRARLLEAHAPPTDAAHPDDPSFEGELRDPQLRMLFACCDDGIPAGSQLALALKVLCGFGVREIAARLFVGEEGVYKRLARARATLRERGGPLDELDVAALETRRPRVHAILYLLFTEGHLSLRASAAIRRELCHEAIRLATVLAEHPAGHHPETFALLALMHLHAARMTAREDPDGGLLLLEEQDRARWDRDHIAQGLAWLARSAHGDVLSRYHAEAGIAAEHALAPTMDATRWDRVVSIYRQLEALGPSPIHTLNRAIATAEWKGPEAGLAVVRELVPPAWLEGSYLWSAVLADLHGRGGDREAAQRHRDRALAAAPTQAVRALLERRLRR